MKGSAEVLAVILVLYSSNLFLAIKGDYPSHWVQPDVWSRSNNVKNVHNLADQEGPCPVCETCPAHTIGNHENIAVFDSQQSSTDFRPNENECNANEEHGHFLFKKLANFLLDRKQFKWNEVQSEYSRKFNFIISVDQYNRLDKVKTSQDIDSILSEILFQSKSSTFKNVQDNLFTWQEQFRDFFKSTVVWFYVQVFGFVGLWIASRRYKFNFCFVCLAFGMYLVYSAVYAECNRALDIKKIVALREKGAMSDPCEIEPKTGIPGLFQRAFGSNQARECQDYLKKHYNTAETCSILEFYNQFVEIFFYNNAFNFFEKIADLIASIYSGHGFIILTVLLITTVTLVSQFGSVFIMAFFKYNLNSIIGFLFGKSSDDTHSNSFAPLSAEHHDTHTTNKLIDLAAQQQQMLQTFLNRESNKNSVCQNMINCELTDRIEDIPVARAKENAITYEANNVEDNNSISVEINEGERVNYLMIIDRYCSDDIRKETLMAMLSSKPYITMCAKTRESQMLHLWFEIDEQYQIVKRNYVIRKAKRLSSNAYELAVDLDDAIDLSRDGLIELLDTIYTKKTVYLDVKEIGELYLQLLCLTDMKSFVHGKTGGDTDDWSNSDFFISQVDILAKCKTNVVVIKSRIDKIEKALKDAKQEVAERRDKDTDAVETVSQTILEAAQRILINERAFKTKFKCKSVG